MIHPYGSSVVINPVCEQNGYDMILFHDDEDDDNARVVVVVVVIIIVVV